MSTDTGDAFIIHSFDTATGTGALDGVLFAEDFDLGDEAPIVAPAADLPVPPELPPALSEADIHCARSQGYDDGLRAGLEEAAARAHLAQQTAADALAQALGAADRAATDVAARASNAVAQAMLQSLAALLPELCAHHGTGEAEALAAALLPMLTHQPRLVIRTAPQDVSALQAIAAAHEATRPHDGGLNAIAGARISVIATDALRTGDVTIEWADGAARRDTAPLLQRLRGVLAPLGIGEGQLPASRAGAANYDQPPLSSTQQAPRRAMEFADAR